MLAYVRRYEGEQVLCVANLSRFAQPVELDLSAYEGMLPVEMLGYVPHTAVAPTATVYPLSGVCWYAEERPDATVWTTLDRDVPVQVTVPRRYSAPGQWVIEFSPVVAAAQSPRPGPPGCTG